MRSTYDWYYSTVAATYRYRTYMYRCTMYTAFVRDKSTNERLWKRMAVGEQYKKNSGPIMLVELHLLAHITRRSKVTGHSWLAWANSARC